MANVDFSQLNSISSSGQISPKAPSISSGSSNGQPQAGAGSTSGSFMGGQSQAGYTIQNYGGNTSKYFTPGVLPDGTMANTEQDFINYSNKPKLGTNTQNQQSPQAQAPVQVSQQPTFPQVGNPSTIQSAVPTGSQNSSISNQGSVAQDPAMAQKYAQSLNSLQGTKTPDSAGAARQAITESTAAYQSPEQPYQPSQRFLQVGDPIMNTFVQAAMSYQNDAIQTGYAAKQLQAEFSNQVQDIDLQAANMQNIMNGTRDDIRAEIGKAGGFATESQVEGLVTTRNRDLLKQYNNLELQKQTMQNQMQLQVGLAQADHQFAVDKFDNLTKTASLYKGIYDNTTDQIDKLVQNVGYSGLATAYNNDPYVLSSVEQHMGMPQGTLSDPKSLQSLETYRQKTLNLSNARFGATYGYQPGSTVTNNYINTPNASYSSGGTPSTLPGGGAHPEVNPNVPYEQYGLLSHTNFDPSNATDKNALAYINTYLNGKLPQNGGDIGISVRGAVGSQQYQSAVSRANDLYFAATGQNLPPTDVIKSNLDIIGANNKLQNNLKVQENTVNANFGLSLQNLNANNLNQGWTVVNNVLNDIGSAEQNPAVAQYIAQNTTIQQELGNLLAVKNAAGTTVYDKVAGAGLMPKGASPDVQVRIVKTLLSEAKNASNAFNQANGELYQQVDPLERQTNNPNRQSYINSQVPNNWVTMSGPKGTFKVDPKNVDIMKKNGYK